MERARPPLLCRWASCPRQNVAFGSPEELALHVEEVHVDPCINHDLFICQWEGCKVYNRPSYSFGWLQRHVKQKHTKERPNKCLMNGCNMSFNSVDALTKHMLRHFDQTPSSSTSPTFKQKVAKESPKVKKEKEGGGGESSVVRSDVKTEAIGDVLHVEVSPVAEVAEELEEGNSKTLQSSGKAVSQTVPYKRQHSLKVKIPRKTLFSFSPYSNIPIAFNGAHFHCEAMDRRTMSVIRHTTNSLAQQDLASPLPSITLTAQILGKRKQNFEEEEEVLVRWTPRIVPDQWVFLSDFTQTRVIPFSELPSSQLSLLASKCFSFDKFHGRKSKRKP